MAVDSHAARAAHTAPVAGAASGCCHVFVVACLVPVGRWWCHIHPVQKGTPSPASGSPSIECLNVHVHVNTYACGCSSSSCTTRGSAGGFVSVGSRVCWAVLGLLVVAEQHYCQAAVVTSCGPFVETAACRLCCLVVVVLSSSVAACSVWMAALPTMSCGHLIKWLQGACQGMCAVYRQAHVHTVWLRQGCKGGPGAAVLPSCCAGRTFTVYTACGHSCVGGVVVMCASFVHLLYTCCASLPSPTEATPVCRCSVA